MMKYVPECTQIRGLNTAKSTICDILSEVMVTTAAPPGMEAGFTQPIMATPAQLSRDRDVQEVQFMDEVEGSGKPQATAVQDSHEMTPYWTEETSKSSQQNSDSQAETEKPG